MTSSNVEPGLERTPPISMADFVKKVETINVAKNQLKRAIFKPKDIKTPPTFNLTQIADLCKIPRTTARYYTTKEGTPEGSIREKGKGRIYSLAEARQWVQQHSGFRQSPLLYGEEGSARVLISSNLKGGTAKTTTALNLAHALTLRGRKVLLVDLDPQASLTDYCGYENIADLPEKDSQANLFNDISRITLEDNAGLAPALDKVRETYWDGLYLVPGDARLHSAEYLLPNYVAGGGAGMKVVGTILNDLKPYFDYIILDTSPSLSYMTANAISAADGIIMPITPNSLDFISSLRYWDIVAETLFDSDIIKDSIDFISILPSNVDTSGASAAPVVIDWMKSVYGDWVSSVSIPNSVVMSSAATELKSVFDVDRGEYSSASLQRIRQPFEQYAEWIDSKYF